ncbi:Acyl-CoA synthetase family member 2, partial [Blattella germanica]
FCSTTSAWKELTKHSYWHRPGHEPLLPLTTGQLVEHAAKKWGDREALVSVHQNQRLSFKQVCEKADKLAAGLVQLGMQHGDRVGIWGPNSTEWYLTQMAAARAGLMLVNINPAYQIPELNYCLNKVGVKALIASEKFKSQNYHQMVEAIAPEINTCQPGKLKSKNLPELKSLIFISEKYLKGSFRFDDILSSANEEGLQKIHEMQDNIQSDEGCNIQFTSGTTGKPKATVLTHHGTVNNAFIVGRGLGFSLEPEESLNTIDKEKCTFLYGTPTMYVDLLNAVDRVGASLTSLQVALSTGAHCSQYLFQQMLKKLQLKRVSSVYGLTETSPVIFQTHVDDTEEQATTTLGHSLDHLEVKVVDSEGRLVPFGTPGELCVRGFGVMLGYWGDEAKTKEVLGEDRWFKTGDQFILQEDGRGRVIFGIEDERMGEEICAAIRTREGIDVTQSDISAFCKGKISHFKVPRHVLAVSDFPKTTSGKIQKFKLKEMLEQKLGANK